MKDCALSRKSVAEKKEVPITSLVESVRSSSEISEEITSEFFHSFILRILPNTTFKFPQFTGLDLLELEKSHQECGIKLNHEHRNTLVRLVLEFWNIQ